MSFASATSGASMGGLDAVDILLACYNGERYLPAQLDSLLAQTDCDWRLLVHDDGSSDGTPALIRDYQMRYPDKIHFIEDGVCCGGAKNNFSHLMALSNADLIMFCDQDDVWYPQKIARSRECMRAGQGHHPAKALLVHSDLEVVDAELCCVAPSMFAYQCLSKQADFAELLVQNSVTGCTVMINRKALLAALPVPEEAIMHDWWLALKVMDSGGELLFLDEPLLKYRQHRDNTLGSQTVNLWHYFKKLRGIVTTTYAITAQASLFRDVAWPQILVQKLRYSLRRLKA
ncbi:MAG: glycosyltransferase family 2 protein [Spongiibacteraceae bacterium]